jgi:NAD(P)-dependent dehydrogenase (short-subunit alcohol dehydrogenase family)
MSDKDLQDRVALVTGASRGIGAAVAKELSARGAHVIALARTQSGLEALDDEIRAVGGAATLIPLDLTKFAEVDKLGPSIYERFGRLDILVGNAGMLGPLTPVHHLEYKDYEKVMRLNVAANARLIHTLDPLLRASDAGRSVFMTSGMAELCYAYYGAYSASKAALSAMIKCYAAEILKTNMKVNLFSPGMVDTKMLAEAFPGGVEDGHVSKPDDVAAQIVDLCMPSVTQHGEVISYQP